MGWMIIPIVLEARTEPTLVAVYRIGKQTWVYPIRGVSHCIVRLAAGRGFITQV